MKLIIQALIVLNLLTVSAAAQIVQADSDARAEFSALCQGDALRRDARTEARCSALLDIQINQLKKEIENRRQSSNAPAAPPSVSTPNPSTAQPDIMQAQPTEPQFGPSEPEQADLWSAEPVEVDIFQNDVVPETLMVINIAGQPLWDAPYVAQLGAFSTVENAQNAWQEWKPNVPQGTENYQVQIKSKLKDGRTLYLLQLGPFASKEDTRALCRQLGNGCYAVQS